MIRLIKLGISLVILIALLAFADRLSARVAGQLVADQIKSNQNLSTTPKVTITGVPFLTQLVRGSYDEVDATAVNVPMGELRATALNLKLYGVQVKAKDVVTQSVTSIPVDHANGTVLLSYAEINRWGAKHHVKVSYGANGDVTISGSITVAGRTFSGSAAGSLSAVPNGIKVTVGQVQAQGLSPVVSGLLGNRLTFVVPTSGLPYGLTITSVDTTAAGVLAQAGVGAFSIPVHG